MLRTFWNVCINLDLTLQLSEALFREENCRLAVVPTCLVFKIAFNEAGDTVFCFTCRKIFKEKKNKTSTKADPAFVSSSLAIDSSEQIIKSFAVYFF